VLTGEQASELAKWLTDATPQWRSWADQVAKHLVTLGVAPDGRVRSLAMDIPLNWVPDGWLQPAEARELLANRLGSLTGRANGLSIADHRPPTSTSSGFSTPYAQAWRGRRQAFRWSVDHDLASEHRTMPALTSQGVAYTANRISTSSCAPATRNVFETGQ
jgi:hypothetical protein